MHSSLRSVYSFYKNMVIHVMPQKTIVTYEHECLVAVFEEGEVLELDQPDGDVVLVHEEPGEQHERDDQDRGQGHRQLLVCEEGGNDESVAAGCTVD